MYHMLCINLKIIGKGIFVTGILIFIFCFTSSASTLMHTGILRVELNKFKAKFALSIYNTDGSVFARVYRNEDDGEYKVEDGGKKINNELLKEIRAYYPDYGLMIFDADTIQKGRYTIYVGSQIKYIKSNEIQIPLISYQGWQSFFKTVFVKTNAESSIYTDTLSNKKVGGAEKYSYAVKKVVGDWAYVECLKACEQCPTGIIIKGWVKWRDKNKLLIDIFYFC